MLRPFVLALAFAAGACQSQIPHGTGPVALQPNVQLAFQRHLDHDQPLVFLVGIDGATAFGRYCPYLECEPDPLYILAEKRCEERLGQPCRVFAEHGRIVWRGPVGHVSPGDGVVAGAAVDWGGTGTLYNLKIDGLGPGPGTVSGKIHNAACAGAIDIRSRSWRLECGAEMRARGALSEAGAGRWRGFGWSEDQRPVRIFVAANVALGGQTASAGGSFVSPPAGGTTVAFSDQRPTFEDAAQMAIRGGDRVSFRWRR